MRRRRLARITGEMIRVESPWPSRDRALQDEVTENGLRLAPFRRGGGWPRSLPMPEAGEDAEWIERAIRALRAGLHMEARGVLDGVAELLEAGEPPASEPTAGDLDAGEVAADGLLHPGGPLLRLAAEWVRWTGRTGAVAGLTPLLPEEADASPPGEGSLGPLGSTLDDWLGPLLGARPDAPVGRLRLAPAFPAGWSHATVTRLRVADARVHLRYRHEGGLRTFTVRQEEGRVPLNVVFQPLLPGRPRAVRVGGRPAEPTVGEESGGVRVSLQFPLDPQREIQIDDADDAVTA